MINHEDIALSFKNFGISILNPAKPILSNVSGYVKKGGITAVMGASASGKSLLLQVLAGRVQNLSITGELLMDGLSIDPKDIQNSIGYVPQDDILIGELTAREMMRNAVRMKRNKPLRVIDDDVQKLLNDFGLGHVADNAIGTVFVRGLSGGQKKRVDVATELVAAPPVLLLDEPTSGLDGSIAFEVLNSIKNILKASEGKLSILLSIHQPNKRILELFDNIMLIGGGGMIFFGTVPESIRYFSSIGFPPPEEYTPTDYFLQISDTNFGTSKEFDFEGSFGCSLYAADLFSFLDDVKRVGMNSTKHMIKSNNLNIYEDNSTNAFFNAQPNDDDNNDAEAGIHHDLEAQPTATPVRVANGEEKASNIAFVDFHHEASFWRQYVTLLSRDFTLAWRDPSLYYLQFVLVDMFGFLIGATFLGQKYLIGSQMNNITGGLLWVVMMVAYIQVFKVYHLSKANIRFKHERANNTYCVLAYWLSELTSTSILLVSFLPGVIIAYFMMGFPGKCFPFLLLLYWMAALTAESMLNFITKFSTITTVSIVSCQAVLVILTVFGGGIFIPWNQTPDYWIWLQELSLFTQASRSAITNVLDHLTYKCTLQYGVCYGPLGDIFPCIAGETYNNKCHVHGRQVLYVLQGTSPSDSHWTSFGYLVLIFVVFRLLILFLMYFPVERLTFMITEWWTASTTKDILAARIDIRRLEGQLTSFMAMSQGNGNIAKRILDRRPFSAEHRDEYAPMFEEYETNPNGSSGGGGTTSHHHHHHHHRVKRNEPCLTWKNLDVVLKTKGTKLIDNVSGTARASRVLALMGPSGAGKTTLLNALGNRAPYANVTGEISFGKRAFHSADLVFVPQFDEVNGNFTVYEQIEYVGLMKCRDKSSMHIRLLHLLQILGLSTKSKTPCQYLSGGELKRVSVGIGMISNPNVLFLDEPTTGLDSSAAFSIVNYLVELAINTNVAVIMTIHQPAEMVFDMLQDLFLLEGGRLAYFGPLQATQRYFQSLGYECPTNTNPSDFYLDLIYNAPTIAHSKSWKDMYASSRFSRNIARAHEEMIDHSEMAPNAEAPPNDMIRFIELLIFFFKYYYREIGFYFLRIGFLILIAFYIGTLFLQLKTETHYLLRYSGAIFFNIWAVLFSAVAATGLLASDRRQAVEQVKNGIFTPNIYCLAQFIASVPFNFISSLIFQSIFHWLSNINPDGESFIYAVLLTCGHLLLMEAIMLLVVAILKNAMLSVTFAMVVMGSLFLFSGFFVAVKNMPHWISWICYIIPTKYSFDGYLYEIFHSQTFTVSSSSTSSTLSGDTVLSELFNQSGVKPWPMFVVLLAWIALFRLCHYGAFVFEVLPFLRVSKSHN